MCTLPFEGMMNIYLSFFLGSKRLISIEDNMLLSLILLVLIKIQSSLENETVVFARGEAGYSCIRIPSILTTVKGTLIAFAEARMYTCDDTTLKDIVYKRSVDNGQTWLKLQILYRGNSSGENFNWVGNLPPVQLKYNQRILFPFCKNNRRIMQTYSDDDGVTFSPAQVIPNVIRENWQWVGLGPPGGLLLQSNRILITGHYSTNGSAIATSSVGFVMLNDFNGQLDKWYVGGEYSLENYYPSESQAVELLPKTNSIFINARSYDTKRIGAYSEDGGITFNKITLLKTLVQPLYGCEGSTLYHPKSHKLFYTGLAETSTIRTNLSLYVSADNGENWAYIKTICPGSSSYSSMATLNDQSIGLLYEKGVTMGAIESLTFTIIYNETQKNFL